jgi:hypothetical protein
MISIFSDTKKLEYALARLADAAKVDLGLVIKQEGAYVARTIMQITPPTGDKLAKGAQTQIPIVTGGTITKTKAGGLSTNAREQGENAIKGDLFGGRNIGKEKSIGLFQRIRNSTNDSDYMTGTFRVAGKDVRMRRPQSGGTETISVNLGWEGSKKIRIYRKFWQESASIPQMRSFHHANRNERGRPKQVSRSLIGRWQVQDQMWISDQAADAYLQYVQKKVGLGKAGFAAAAMACGVRVPAWIRRHMAKAGTAQVQFGQNPFVSARTTGNKIPDLQRVVDSALKIRYKVTLNKFRAVMANRAVNLGFTKVGGAMPLPKAA